VLRKAIDRMTRALPHMDDSSVIVGDDRQGVTRWYALVTWRVTVSATARAAQDQLALARRVRPRSSMRAVLAQQVYV
jgi:hypothetical protein